MAVSVTAAAFTAGSAAGVKYKNELVYDGHQLQYRYTPLSVKGSTYVPLQVITDLLGAQTVTDAKTRSVSVSAGDFSMKLIIGSKNTVVNGVDIELPEEVLENNHVPFIPLDLAMNATSDRIAWESETNTATLELFADAHSSSIGSSRSSDSSGSTNLSLNSPALMGDLVLVNKWNSIPASFVPDSLTSILDKNYHYIVPGRLSNIKLKNELLAAYSSMWTAMNKAGVKNLVISNSYRAYSLQSTYYNNKIYEYSRTLALADAKIKAATIVAPPGTSEHQTGLAMDVTTYGELQKGNSLSENFGSTPEGKWVEENSWNYGIIVRYHKEKTKFTGIISEPWHIRYVGAPHAEIMKKNNLCLEQYLEMLKEKRSLEFKSASGKTYEICYIDVSAPAENLSVQIPTREICDISRYGKTGFIITRVKT